MILMHYSFLLLAVLFLVVRIAYEGFIHYKRNISDIILIKDINVSIRTKISSSDNQNNSSKNYTIYFENIDNPKDYFTLSGYSNYRKYNGVSRAVAQEIFYSYKGEIFSCLCFAKDIDYNRLEQYKISNNQMLLMDEIESIAHKTNNKFQKIKNILGFIVVVLFLIHMLAPIFLYN